VTGTQLLAFVVATDGAYGVAAGSVRSWLERSPRRIEAASGAGGVVMVGLGVRLALTGRQG
jgi:threonine/homoserine/homoserine lactone efflux protein